MGLVTGLLTLPLAPARGFGWVIKQIAEAGEDEFYDPAEIREELRELYEAADAGEITPEEFDAREDELLDRLDVALGIADEP
ncbi:MAG TPA: gas vesicle protein GvpG [Actinopolymorphaceae bacterium]|jgi:hypothetical protein